MTSHSATRVEGGENSIRNVEARRGVESNPEILVEQRDRRFLGWKDDTCYLDKVQDVELREVTGEDRVFVAIHHDVRDLLDAQSRLGNTVEPLSFTQLYVLLKKGEKRILVNELDQYGKLTGEQIDLYGYAHLERIKSTNELLGVDRMDEEELEARFKSGEPLVVGFGERDLISGRETGKRGSLDLRSSALRPYVSEDDFNYYFNSLQESQTGLQRLSALRDASIKTHHAENSGHAQMAQVEPGRWMYVPVGLISAMEYTRADVKKTSESFRANGHVHEIGWYEENTSTLVRIEAEAYDIWRGQIGTSRTHEQSNNRMIDNCLALGSGEKLRLANRQEKSYHFGGAGQGKIYKAMRHHYNKAMQETRGFGITDQEIGDKIITDIVGVAFASNPIDWLMSFAAGTKLYTRQQIIDKKVIEGGGNGPEAEQPVFIFDGAKHIEGEDVITRSSSFLQKDLGGKNVVFGTVKIKGVPALSNYIQWRIALGDIPGISKDTKISLKGVDEKIQKEEDGEPDSNGEEKEFTEDQITRLASVLKGVFGDSAIVGEYLRAKADGGGKKDSKKSSGNAGRFGSSFVLKTTASGGGKKEETIDISTPDRLKVFIEKRIGENSRTFGADILVLTEKSSSGDAAEALLVILDTMSKQDIYRVIKAL